MKGFARRAAIVAASVVVALVVVEVALRLFLGARYAALYRVNDVWLWEHVPGVHRVNDSPDGKSVAFDVNADGFRGAELRPPGAGRRVVVYGDSFVAAKATPLDETFVARLGTRLGADVEALNAGVVGYGVDQVCLRMDAELARLRPDLVVVVVTAENDYGDNVRNRLFEIDAQGVVRRYAPVIPQGMRDAYAAAQSGLLIPKVVRGAADRVRERLHGTTSQPTYGVEEELAQCADDHGRAVIDRGDAVIVGVDHPDADVRVAPASETARYKVALMGGVLAAVRDVARTRGVPLLVVVVPSAADVCRHYDRDAVDRSAYPDYRPDNLTRPIDRIASSLDVAYVDLFPAFAAADADALYFKGGDTHWNSAGQVLAADLVAPAVAARMRGR